MKPPAMTSLLKGGERRGQPSDPGARNKVLMENHVKPRLYGFLKTLWGVALKAGETPGWQINEEQRDELRHALSYILGRFGRGNDVSLGGDEENLPAAAAAAASASSTEAVSIPDDQVPPLFYMLTNGLFHCPTGQVEGISAIIYSLLSTGAEQTDLERRLERMLALQKIKWFPRAVLTEGGPDNTQNVHLISYYRQLLREQMKLASAVQSYEERMGVLRHDPFSGNMWNVVKTFYDIVTPDRMAGWILARTENKESLALRVHQRDLEKALSVLEPPTQFTESQLQALKKRKLVVPGQQPKTLDDDTLNRLKEKGINHSNQKALKMALQVTKAKIEQDRMHRFFTVGDMVAYFKDKGIIPAGQPEQSDYGAASAASAAEVADNAVDSPWWKDLFTHNPEDPDPALLTKQGALKILELMGMLVVSAPPELPPGH